MQTEIVSREDRGGKKRGQKHSNTTRTEDKKYKERKKILGLSVHPPIRLSICFHISVFASCIFYLLGEEMGAASETSFGVTVKRGNESLQRQTSPPSTSLFQKRQAHTNKSTYAHIYTHKANEKHNTKQIDPHFTDGILIGQMRRYL